DGRVRNAVSSMFISVMCCLVVIAATMEILPGFETNRFGLNFNLCPPQLPPKIVYLPAPCRFDAEQDEIRLALARLDANMGQNEVSPAPDPVKVHSNTLDGSFYDISIDERGTVSRGKWRRL
ncbi:hypothetical protein PENTCL1PPCAC_16533, partial [Pristionchus entomophagus]